ncbi:uncharacterized protein LOC141904130 isoform X2 [Tubulanus polymorphus]
MKLRCLMGVLTLVKLLLADGPAGPDIASNKYLDLSDSNNRTCPEVKNSQCKPEDKNDYCFSDDDCCRHGDKCCSDGCRFQCTPIEELDLVNRYSECPRISVSFRPGHECSKDESFDICRSNSDCCRQGDRCCFNGCRYQCIPHEELVTQFCQMNGSYYQTGDTMVVSCDWNCICSHDGNPVNCTRIKAEIGCHEPQCPTIFNKKRCLSWLNGRYSDNDVVTCESDKNCSESSKCCSNGCENICTKHEDLIIHFCYSDGVFYQPGDEFIVDCHLCRCGKNGTPENCTPDNCEVVAGETFNFKSSDLKKEDDEKKVLSLNELKP